MKQPFDLIDARDSVLVLIDVQEYFLRKLDAGTASRVVGRIRWLVQVAGWFQIPIIATAENLERNGPTVQDIRSAMGPGAPDIDKMTFGLAAQTTVIAAIRATGRKTAVLVGLETDVCVQQSALGLAELGYFVVAVIDAVASPGADHQIGLDRMQCAGITMASCKSLFYEWARDVGTASRMARERNIEVPDGLLL